MPITRVPKDAALRQAKLDYIKTGRAESPFYWAAFIPVGDMSPMYFEKRNNWFWVMGCTVLIGLFLFSNKKKIIF